MQHAYQKMTYAYFTKIQCKFSASHMDPETDVYICMPRILLFFVHVYNKAI